MSTLEPPEYFRQKGLQFQVLAIGLRSPTIAGDGSRGYNGGMQSVEQQRAASTSDEQLSREQIALRLRVSVSTVARMEKRGQLPAGRRISPGCVRWSAREFERWLAER